MNKNIAELDHGDLLSVYESSFAKLPISSEILNRFWFKQYLVKEVIYMLHDIHNLKLRI